MTLYVCGQKISNKSKITFRSGATYTVVGEPQEDSLRCREWIIQMKDFMGRTAEFYCEWSHRGCWRFRASRYISATEDFDALDATAGDYVQPEPMCYCQTFLHGHEPNCSYRKWRSDRRKEDGRQWFEVK